MELHLQDLLAWSYFGLACLAFGFMMFAFARRASAPGRPHGFATSGAAIAGWLLIALANIVFLVGFADRRPAWGLIAAGVVVLASLFNAGLALAKRRRMALAR